MILPQQTNLHTIKHGSKQVAISTTQQTCLLRQRDHGRLLSRTKLTLLPQATSLGTDSLQSRHRRGRESHGANRLSLLRRSSDLANEPRLNKRKTNEPKSVSCATARLQMHLVNAARMNKIDFSAASRSLKLISKSIRTSSALYPSTSHPSRTTTVSTTSLNTNLTSHHNFCPNQINQNQFKDHRSS